MINDPLAELWKGERKPDALEDPDMDEEYIPRMSDTDYGKRFTSNLKAKRPQSPKGDLIPQSGATSRLKAKRPVYRGFGKADEGRRSTPRLRRGRTPPRL